MSWHDRYTAEHWDHERDLRKHEPRPGDRDFPLRLDPAPPSTALEVAILVQAIPLAQAADLIDAYADNKAAGIRLDAVAAGARP